MIKIALIEDNAAVAHLMEQNLTANPGFEVLFTASNGVEMQGMLKTYKPDLILMDIHMPVMDGITSVKYIKQNYPDIKIIMHTVLGDESFILQAIINGANGYLLKNEKPQHLHEAIKEVLEGGAPMTPGIAQKVLTLLAQSHVQPFRQLNGLTDRETEILGLVAEGNTYKKIADRLFISTKTVGKHIENIYQKLQVNNKVEAINLYKKNNTGNKF